MIVVLFVVEDCRLCVESEEAWADNHHFGIDVPLDWDSPDMDVVRRVVGNTLDASVDGMDREIVAVVIVQRRPVLNLMSPLCKLKMHTF